MRFNAKSMNLNVYGAVMHPSKNPLFTNGKKWPQVQDFLPEVSQIFTISGNAFWGNTDFVIEPLAVYFLKYVLIIAQLRYEYGTYHPATAPYSTF